MLRACAFPSHLVLFALASIGVTHRRSSSGSVAAAAATSTCATAAAAAALGYLVLNNACLLYPDTATVWHRFVMRVRLLQSPTEEVEGLLNKEDQGLTGSAEGEDNLHD